MLMFSLYDSKSESFSQPFFCRTRGAAVRAITDEVNDERATSDVHRHPVDFELYEIGEFNESRGCFTASEALRSVALVGSLRSS